MDQIQVLFKSLFPVSIQVLSSDDLKDLSVWSGNMSTSEVANLLNVEHFESLVKGKTPDAIYEATIPFRDANVTPVEGGYRVRYQCNDLTSLNDFLEAIANA